MASDNDNSCVWSDEQTELFSRLILEKTIVTIFNRKQQQNATLDSLSLCASDQPAVCCKATFSFSQDSHSLLKIQLTFTINTTCSWQWLFSMRVITHTSLAHSFSVPTEVRVAGLHSASLWLLSLCLSAAALCFFFRKKTKRNPAALGILQINGLQRFRWVFVW